MRSTHSVGRGLFDRALDLVFPQRCVGCDAWGSLICEMCEATMVEPTPPLCRRCSITSVEPVCYSCREWRPAFTAVRSAYCYEGAARDAVLALKFRGVSSIAPVMATQMADRFAQWDIDVEAIIPVPLASGRKRSRGYDQAELLAKAISKLVGVPMETRAVKRRRSTAAQARLGERERRENLAGAFVKGKARLNGPVLLVDDVITTGATLDAVARVLVDSGTELVYGLTFARD